MSRMEEIMTANVRKYCVSFAWDTSHANIIIYLNNYQVRFYLLNFFIFKYLKNFKK